MNDVILAVGRIRNGRWVTFGELAELAGHPGAARSAGRITHAHEDGYETPTWRLFKAGGQSAERLRRGVGREGVAP